MLQKGTWGHSEKNLEKVKYRFKVWKLYCQHRLSSNADNKQKDLLHHLITIATHCIL